jgi:hypothetical protein
VISGFVTFSISILCELLPSYPLFPKDLILSPASLGQTLLLQSVIWGETQRKWEDNIDPVRTRETHFGMHILYQLHL